MKNKPSENTITLALPAEHGICPEKFRLGMKGLVFLLLLAGGLGTGAELLGIRSASAMLSYGLPAIFSGGLLLSASGRRGFFKFLPLILVLLLGVFFLLNASNILHASAESVNRLLAQRQNLTGKLIQPMECGGASPLWFRIPCGIVLGLLLGAAVNLGGAWWSLLLLPLWYGAARGYLTVNGWLPVFTLGCVMIPAVSCADPRSALQTTALAAALCAVIAGTVLVSRADGHLPAEKLKTTVTHGIHDLRYETGVAMPEGFFADYGTLPSDGDCCLNVEMTAPESMYLRGMVGASYTACGWEPISAQVRGEMADSFYWLRKNSFFSENQLAVLSEALGKTPEPECITVTADTACTAWRYLPGNLADSDGLDAADLFDGERRAEGLNGEREYSFSVEPGAVQNAYVLLDELEAHQTDPAAAEYLRLEGNYRSFVYENYLEVPEDCTAYLKRFPELSAEPASSFEAKELILQILAENACFDKNAEILSGGSGLVEALFRTGGTSVHYATAAVLMLRSMGIPARYAEGYVITMEEAERCDGRLSLRGSSAHAWAEYYEDGLGWLPFEVTPPLIGKTAEPVWQRFTAGGTEEAPQAEEPEPQPEEIPPMSDAGTAAEQWMQRETEASPKPQNRFDIRIMLLIACGSLFLMAIVWLLLRHRRILRRRREAFADSDFSAAIGRMFSHSIALMASGGFEAKNVPFVNQGDSADEWFGEENPFREMQRLNEEALFSTHPLTEAQRDSMTEFMKQTQGKLLSGLGFAKRLYQRWIRCMY